MIIKTKKNWKDLADGGSNHKGWTRRDFMVRGLATGFMTMSLPKLLGAELFRQAYGAELSCPTPVMAKGALGQIFAEGGATIGARFISTAQANMMSSGMAKNYGITGTNLMQLGPKSSSNLWIDTQSPFGFTLLQGPPGYPGGASAWQTNVLSKVSAGGHLGPFNQDDGAGVDTGLLGGMSPFKTSKLGKDLKVNVKNTLAAWANGLPAASTGGNLSPASFAKQFGLTPAAAGLTTSASMTATSDAANALSKAMSTVLGTDKRKAGDLLQTNAGCAFYGNAALADPNFGTNLFTPANISALSNNVTVGNLTNAEQAQLAAYYQSAIGMAGGVVIQFDGRDYHGASPQNTIAPADIEEARAIVMFLAACDAASAPGSMIYLSNGNAIANGTQAVTATINGQTANLQAPVASGDAGGAYNAGLILFYDPSGAPPAAKFTGTVDSTTGNAKVDPSVASSKDAVAGLYLSALKWVSSGTVPDKAVQAMQSAGVSPNLNSILVV